MANQRRAATAVPRRSRALCNLCGGEHAIEAHSDVHYALVVLDRRLKDNNYGEARKWLAVVRKLVVELDG